MSEQQNVSSVEVTAEDLEQIEETGSAGKDAGIPEEVGGDGQATEVGVESTEENAGGDGVEAAAGDPEGVIEFEVGAESTVSDAIDARDAEQAEGDDLAAEAAAGEVALTPDEIADEAEADRRKDIQKNCRINEGAKSERKRVRETPTGSDGS